MRLSLIVPVGPGDEAAFQRFLHSLAAQTYPLDQLEVLAMQAPSCHPWGPSPCGAEEAAERQQHPWLHRWWVEGNSEEAKAKGIARAQGDLVGMFCSDNDFTEPDVLARLVAAASAPEVVGAFTARYAWVRSDRALSRYFALLGNNDPVCWWLGKADRRSYLVRPPAGISSVRFLDRLPSLGDNGCLLKRALVQRVLPSPERFGSCMCLCADLAAQGNDTYAIVPSDGVWHRTGESAVTYFSKRWRYVNALYWGKLHVRRWRMVRTPGEWLAVCGFALASLLVLPQLCVSLAGYRRVRDPAWFLHPLVCGVLTLLYAWACLRQLGLRCWTWVGGTGSGADESFLRLTSPSWTSSRGGTS